jgi:hypothetical protein
MTTSNQLFNLLSSAKTVNVDDDDIVLSDSSFDRARVRDLRRLLPTMVQRWTHQCIGSLALDQHNLMPSRSLHKS